MNATLSLRRTISTSYDPVSRGRRTTTVAAGRRVAMGIVRGYSDPPAHHVHARRYRVHRRPAPVSRQSQCPRPGVLRRAQRRSRVDRGRSVNRAGHHRHRVRVLGRRRSVPGHQRRSRLSESVPAGDAALLPNRAHVPEALRRGGQRTCHRWRLHHRRGVRLPDHGHGQRKDWRAGARRRRPVPPAALCHRRGARGAVGVPTAGVRRAAGRADEAVALGLADEAAAPEALLDRACQHAVQLATIPPITFR